ncbi:MAG: TonB-dependent siderophore receptor [Beijerinckiaceae bacterium]|nr:TonB-dependent siderophore receptor [Beijerinckiaceae bacterium]
MAAGCHSPNPGNRVAHPRPVLVHHMDQKRNRGLAALLCATAILPASAANGQAQAEERPPLPRVTIEAPQEKPRPIIRPKPARTASKPRASRRVTARRVPAAPSPNAEPATGAGQAEAAQWAGAARGEPFGTGPSGVQGYTAAATSTATKTNTPLQNIPQSITILTKQLLEDRNSISLGQALTYVPGVTVAQGEGNRDQITIRGQDTSADFFLDGVRDDAQYYRDLYNIQAVEVLKGPSAVIFGRGGGGGVVNRVTKKADGTSIHQGQFSTGSFGRKRLTVDAGQAVSDRFAVRLNMLYEQSYSFRDFFRLERYGVNPTLTWLPTDSTTIMFAYEHFRDRRTADRGIPSIGGVPVDGLPVAPGYPSPAPIEAFFGNPDVNYAKIDLNRATMAIEQTTDFGVKIRNITSYADYQKRYQNTFPASSVNLDPAAGLLGDVQLDGYLSSNPRQNIFNQTDLTYRFEMTPEIRHTLLAGAEVGNQKTDDFRNLSAWNNPFTGPQRIFTPFWFPTVFNPVFFPTPNRRRHTDLDLAAGYIQDQIEITKYVDVIAGVRFDSFNLKFVESLVTDPKTPWVFHRVDNVWSPRFGVVVKPIEQVSLYASYSRSFLPQAGDQFNVLNVDTAALAPQSFENVEVGFKAQILPRLFFTGALYELNRTNQLVAFGSFNNILANTRTKGGEIGLVGYVTDEWQASLGYGHQDARIVSADPQLLDDPGDQLLALGAAGNVVPSVPLDTFSFWNRYDVTPFLGAGLGVVYNAKFFPALDNAVIVPGYARLDGALFLKFNENFYGQLNVENILGAKYFASAHNNNNIMPGAPRSAFVTVTARF